MPFGSNAERVVVLPGENPAVDFAVTLNSARELLMGAPAVAEAGMVLQNRQGAAGVAALLSLLERWAVRVAPFTAAHALEAMEAYRRYGKGQHRAALNLGDCNSYAVAKVVGARLLCQGDDFAETDLGRVDDSPVGFRTLALDDD
jgi:ribonuclease VapC